MTSELKKYADQYQVQGNQSIDKNNFIKIMPIVNSEKQYRW